MYQKREKQVSLYENSICFATGAPLDPQNRWIKLSGMIPWDQIEEKYSLTFDNPIKGSPAKSCRMAIGSLIIKEMCRLKLVENQIGFLAAYYFCTYIIIKSDIVSQFPVMSPAKLNFDSF